MSSCDFSLLYLKISYRLGENRLISLTDKDWVQINRKKYISNRKLGKADGQEFTKEETQMINK